MITNIIIFIIIFYILFKIFKNMNKLIYIIIKTYHRIQEKKNV